MKKETKNEIIKFFTIVSVLIVIGLEFIDAIRRGLR